jgi:hypothetical protein
MKSYPFLLLFTCYSSIGIAQQRYSVVISEIMADPSPIVSLPTYEWIELTNTSNSIINLQQWRIADASGTSGPMPFYLLKPDSSVIVCSSTAFASLSLLGSCITVTSFPSLDNDGDLLWLKTSAGLTMHAIEYTSAWYRNELKKEGGWTIEMIDPRNACNGASNWKASNDIIGGTPGRVNSVHGLNTDIQPPQLLRSYTTDNSTIILVFDDPVDSLSSATLSHYSIDGNITLSNASSIPPLFNKVQLKTNSPLSSNTIYHITATAISDCNNNNITPTTIKTGLPADPQPAEWIINEILFDPKPGGFDYVEFYNNSDNIFDASKLHIASRNSNGVMGLPKILSPVPYYIFPGEWLLVTEDTANLAQRYRLKDSSPILQLPSLPSLPDDEGNVVILNAQGLPTDEVSYSDDWHFKLLSDKEGISLERIDPSSASQDAGNWHSAASTAGYGTPGYKNSQYRRPIPAKAMIEVSPPIFSPDNDGRDDIAVISYATAEPGFVINVTVYDAAGRPVRHLVRNAILGISGYWTWDGLDDQYRKIPIGTYIVLAEMYNLQAKRTIFKTAIVLARKL